MSKSTQGKKKSKISRKKKKLLDKRSLQAVQPEDNRSRNRTGNHSSLVETQKNCGLLQKCQTELKESEKRGPFQDLLHSLNQPIVRELLIFLIVAVLAGAAYSNILFAPFVLDDWGNIENNPHIRLERLSFGTILRAAQESPDPNRALSYITFALNYYFHGFEVLGYHLTNICIHLLAGLLLFLFFKDIIRVSSSPSVPRPSPRIPFVAALIWLVHPLHIQSVTYTVQRMNSMAAMFFLLSLILYSRARQSENKTGSRVIFGSCLLSAILALASKENAVTLPLFLFLYEWYFFQGLSFTWLRRHWYLFTGIVVLLILLFFLFAGPQPIQLILKGYEGRDFTLLQRVMTEWRIILFYLSLFLLPLPSRLNLDHDFSLSYSLLDPVTTLFALAALVGLTTAAIRLAGRERILSFCLLWFLGNLALESTILPLELVFEHRTYLPSMLLTLLVVMIFDRYLPWQWLRQGLVGAVVLLLALGTYERNKVWRDDVSLWQDCVQKSPDKFRVYHNLGTSLVKKGLYNAAWENFQKTLAINPDYFKAYFNLGTILMMQGRNKESIPFFSKALELNPNHVDSHMNQAVVLTSVFRLEEAYTHCREVLRLDPYNQNARRQLIGIQQLMNVRGKQKP